jgi:type IV pilus assembly protein PilW
MGIEGQMYPILSHDAAGGSLRINAAATPFAAGDIMLVCDFDHTTTFQASAYDTANIAVSHTSGGASPGNCSQGLGFPTNCASSTGNVYLFPQNSQIGRLYAVDWYVGNNGRTDDVGTSLFRRRLGPNATVITEEIVSGVTDMQIQYGRNGTDTINDASGIVGAVAWRNVNSAFITLTVRSSDVNVSSSTANSGRIERQFTYLITMRNRVP